MTALEFAKILIRTSGIFASQEVWQYGSQTPIGNTILNKYLHIAQMFWLGAHKEKLFNDDIICTLNGGVIPEVFDNWEEIVKTSENEGSSLITKKMTEPELLAKFLISRLGHLSHSEIIKYSQLDEAWSIKEGWILRRGPKNIMKMDEDINFYSHFWDTETADFKIYKRKHSK